MVVLREIQKILQDMKLKPVLAIDEAPNMPIKDIHANDLTYLSNCEYAIFEETFPAGELMELERALDYGVKTVVVYQTRTPFLFDYPSQLTSMVVSLVEEKEFNDITLFGYPDLKTLEQFLRGFLKRPLTYSSSCVLVMSLGTLNKAQLSEVEEGQLKNFRGLKILFTGWDLERCKRDKVAEKYNLSAIVSEGCILYTKRQDKGQRWEKTKLYQEEDVEAVKSINELILDEIYFVDYNSVLLSQGDEVSICYYVNPPQETEHIWERLRGDEEVTALQFGGHLLEMCHTIKKSDIRVMNKACLSLPDTKDNRYAVEKVNARYRTFREYALRFEQRSGQKYLFVNLRPETCPRPPLATTYERLVAIVDRARLNPNYSLSSKAWGRVIPQGDGCIDIFARTKEESWGQALEKLKATRKPVFYISRGTESDIPFIRAGYLRGNFCAFGLSNVITSSLLKVAGIVVKKDFREILDAIRQRP